MSKPALAGTEYIAELNRRLASHPEKAEGLEFFIHTSPEAEPGHWIASWTGPEQYAALMEQIRQEVAEEYDMMMKINPQSEDPSTLPVIG